MAAPRGIGRLFGAVVSLAVGLGVVLAGCGRRDPGEAPPHAGRIAPGPAATAPPCPACDSLRVVLAAGRTPDADPHGDHCAICHHDADRQHAGGRHRDTIGDPLPTCTTAGCHPKAWTETWYHRVEPAVFRDCTHCHRPHTWTAVGDDCRSCHGSGGSDAAEADHLAAEADHLVAVAAMRAFPHDRHATLECRTCHAAEPGRHAGRAALTGADCRACHHTGPESSDCGRCHDAATLAPRAVTVQLDLGAATPPRSRSLSFRHDRHAGLACARCHAPGPDATPRAACADCHGAHDRAEADCATCHRPPPPGVHPVSLHDTGCAGAACHDTPGLATTPNRRTLCLACHVDQADHQPGRTCAACHLVSLGHGGGS